ncbi:MAG: response regulator [Candidatus Paceibacterota bacterium]|jgi:DNA-binding response OmpR family regulator
MNKTIKEKYTIAVIEDDRPMSKSLVGELEDAGFEVITAFDGKEGLELILKEKPDLVLLDIAMPIMDGMTMLSQLRRSGEYGKHASIIFLTNLNADDQILDGITKNEPSYYFVKADYTVADVVTKVGDYLKNKFSKVE